jgi:hypothetical protein
MKRLFNYLVVMFFSIVIIGCVSQNKLNNNSVLTASMKYALIINNATTYQVDSLIVADTLPALEKWIYGTFVDDVTGNKIMKRMCFKKNDKQEFVYVISGNIEPYHIVKRIKE